MVLFMSRPTLAGRYRWQCFHQLAFIPELLGVDRRLLVLVFLLGFVIHVSTNLILFPVFLSVVMTLILRRMCKTDRQLMSVLQSAFRYPAAWYDPGLPPAKFGPYIASSSDSAPRDPLEALGVARESSGLSFGTRVFQFLGLVLPLLFRRR